METLSKDLLSELECPVCMEYMLPPIMLCWNGHNICNKCESRLEKCPTCNEAFSNIKNIALESIARKIRVSCKYSDNGCTDTFLLDFINQHQDECPYGSYKCPFAITPIECLWEGQLEEMREHIMEKHTDPSDSRHVLGVHNARLPRFESSSAWCQVLFTLNEIFFRLSKATEDLLFCCVFYVGPKYKACKYNYRLTIARTDGTGVVSSSHETVSYRCDVENVFQEGNCAVFHRGFAKNCTNSEKELVMEEDIFGDGDDSLSLIK